MTGCARSEGYYKIDMRDKVKYLPHHKLKSTAGTEQRNANVIYAQGAWLACAELVVSLQVKSSGRVNRAKQRKLASLYSAGDVSSDIAKYNQFKVS